MAELAGNLLVAQSGGPTSVINASLAGVIQEAGRHECIEEIYGGANGILGILNEELIDINDEKNRTIDGLKYTPAAALGTCRYKIDFKKKPEKAAKDMDRLFEVFQAHNIRYFAYIGGNDSQDTSHKIHEEAVKRSYEMRVIGVPKTIDNDLPHTDNCPGYGSVIKYNATTVTEVGLDVGSMATDDGSCCIIEVMGRSAGWIAAGTVLAKRGNPANPPHIILLPELPFEEEKFLAKVKETVDAYKYCIVVVGEGIKDASGQEVGADKTRLDAFGHPVLAGAAEELKEMRAGQTQHQDPHRPARLRAACRRALREPDRCQQRFRLRRGGGQGRHRGPKRLHGQDCPGNAAGRLRQVEHRPCSRWPTSPTSNTSSRATGSAKTASCRTRSSSSTPSR